jgi:hypothetical protein
MILLCCCVKCSPSTIINCLYASTCIYVYIYIYIKIYIYIYKYIYIYIPLLRSISTTSWRPLSEAKISAVFPSLSVASISAPLSRRVSNDDDVYLRLQHGKGFLNLIYMSYVKNINPVKVHK